MLNMSATICSLGTNRRLKRHKSTVLKTVFSTSDVHPRDRFDYWHEIACKVVIPHDSAPRSRTGFEAELRVDEIADLSLVSFENSPMDIVHTGRHASYHEA